ncbi:discoidin domain-containing protein [Mucilaginibacter psychrotolerans]|uniref:Peptide-N(4)-(N-acetyl-beta-glucosaminyl)asparagine amidase n=1 Tax=Mucilaginibacter psychrotolerans TaxID=1524096 RepID=A0A4Y8SC25_9SPHI|nr:discoidin domain-containing protein [Mucilaginibacter psychrotolerans]TFF36140.1 hypothetical protein E2R66_16475 [Mucilaginibacter psychrotolerans]
MKRLYFAVYICLLFSCKGNITGFNPGANDEKDYTEVYERFANPRDSLKLKAAEFLIGNLSAHQADYGEGIKALGDIFSVIDTLYYKNDNIEEYIKNHILDSVLNKKRLSTEGEQNIIADNRKVTPGYLINNIEFAYKAWQDAPWKTQVNFKDFCEYILPYRIRNEQIELWRPQMYQSYSLIMRNSPDTKDIKSVFTFVKGNLETDYKLSGYFGQNYPYTQNFSDALKGRIGACETITSFSVNILRSIGLPVALEYVPHWGNNNNRNHYWVKLIDHAKNNALFSNENGPVSTWGIVDFSSDFSRDRHYFREEEVPAGMYIQYIKTIPKVYRHTFSEDPLLKDINVNVSGEFISPTFNTATLKDVTDEYMNSSVRMVDIPEKFRSYEVAYLCVFDTDGWQPVAISKIDGDKAIFDKVGNYVMYLPAVYKNGIVIPTGSPFYLDSLNIIHELKKAPGGPDNMHLLRKAPLYSYTAYHTEALKGGRFEGSATADFKNPTLLYQIENFPFYMNEIKIAPNQKFRYLRYVAPPGNQFEADNIAEVQFFGINGKKPLTGSYIGTEGSWDRGIDKAFDNNMDTYYENAHFSNGWIGLDLGKAQQLSMIRFCPRNDTNCIIIGSDYELFYWDNSWISLGTQTAKGYFLDFQNAPKNALYWLRCKTGGKEERIFTMKGKNQLWW